MKLKEDGKNTLTAEVTHIDKYGLWLYVLSKEYFLPYKEYPWFKEAKIKEILDVKFLRGYHLHWPKLDIDLDLNTLGNLEQYPLKYK